MKGILGLFLLIGILHGGDLSRSNGIVIDSSTSLEWKDNITSVQKTWSEAIIYCENINFNEHDDWRLPNRNELLSVVDYSNVYPHVKENKFDYIQASSYWTSSSNVRNSSSAWRIAFNLGDTDDIEKSDSLYVICVRDGQ